MYAFCNHHDLYLRFNIFLFTCHMSPSFASSPGRLTGNPICKWLEDRGLENLADLGCRTKLKQTEVDCELLKRCCETLTIENRRLLKELQELRAIKAVPSRVIAHDFYTPLPAATLTMCPSCERVATADNRSITFSKPEYSHLSQAPTAC